MIIYNISHSTTQLYQFKKVKEAFGSLYGIELLSGGNVQISIYKNLLKRLRRIFKKWHNGIEDNFPRYYILPAFQHYELRVNQIFDAKVTNFWIFEKMPNTVM